MGDLISRSDLYNKLVELETLARNRVLDTPTNSPCYQRYVSQVNERTMFKELVADMRTAYDVDAVEEQLKQQAEQYRKRGFEHEQKGFSAMADKYYGKQCSYLHAIEIVRGEAK